MSGEKGARPQNVFRAPSVTFSQKNQQIPYDEQTTSDSSPRPENSPPRQPRQPRQLQQQISVQANPGWKPEQGSLTGPPPPSSEFSPSELSEIADHQRRNSLSSQRMHQVPPQYDPNIGALAIYNPVEHHLMMPPPPPHPALLARAPSMGQLWYPPPPPFTPYYYAPQMGSFPPDAKTLRKAMKEMKRMEEKRYGESDFSRFCCDGVAQLLWAIILITILGLLTAALMALYVLK